MSYCDCDFRPEVQYYYKVFGSEHFLLLSKPWQKMVLLPQLLRQNNVGLDRDWLRIIEDAAKPGVLKKFFNAAGNSAYQEKFPAIL